MQTSEIRSYIISKSGERSILLAQQKRLLDDAINLNSEHDYILEAQSILQQTAKKTQNKLSYHISSFISSALKSVWGDDAYTFSLDFIEKRNKTEVQMILHTEQGDVSLESLNDIRSGGGVLDIVALALRIALWSLQANHQKVMILDQPFANVDQNHLPKAGQLITELSDRLGIQFIIINHNPVLADIATETIYVEKKDGVSSIIKEN